MKKFKVVMAVVLSVLFLCSMALAADEGGVQLTINSSADAVNVGDTVEISVDLSEGSKLVSLQFDLTYDADALEYVGNVTSGNGYLPASEAIISVTSVDNLAEAGKITCAVIAAGNDGIVSSGTIFTASFKVKAIDGTVSIDLTEAYDENYSDVADSVEADAVEELPCAHGDVKETVTKEATCTEAGSKTLDCNVCGENLGTESISALGHTWGSWTTVKEAEIDVEGLEERVCSVCGEKEERAIAALTPAPTEEPTEAPTEAPTEEPTETPTEVPTEEPTQAPAEKPTEAPTEAPTQAPGATGSNTPGTGDNALGFIVIGLVATIGGGIAFTLKKREEA